MIIIKTIKEASKIAGVSVRTLQYYDEIGLLNPTSYSELAIDYTVTRT
ncbi:MerR family DNA-binding transcriptional regulator [Streptococcus pluranimalium]